jgi:hypothetical protein
MVWMAWMEMSGGLHFEAVLGGLLIPPFSRTDSGNKFRRFVH